jgi:hypothetical protein
MTNSILIGKTIYKLLSESQELTKYLENKIYPLVADSDTTFPFITFSRDNVTPSALTKDGIHEDTVSFSIMVVSNAYLVSLEIANLIRGIFEKKKIIGEDLVMNYVELSGIIEDYQEDSFTQNLRFTCKVTNK